MHGSNERGAALAALALSVIVATGAAAAAPVGVLRATDGRQECVVPLAEGAMFHYGYVQSMYEVPVVEDLVRHGDRIGLLRIRSSEIRALEYYRWDAAIGRDGDRYVQEAPPYETDRLVIRVSPPYAQRLDGAGWTCDLEARFGDDVVSVAPEVRPAASLIR
jgi:hypothetical protein